MKIVIPTHNRVDSVVSLDFIPESYRENVFLVTREGKQYEKYSEKYSNVISVNASNIAEKRHEIVKRFSGELIWQLDDDCILHNTILDNEKNIIKLTDPVNEADFYNFIDYVNKLRSDFPLMIVRNQIFPRGKSYYPYRKNTWSFTNMILDLSVLNAENLGYNLVTHTEDAVAFLNTIDRGYNTCCISKWMVKTILAGKPGGITEIRTPQMIEENAIKIHNMFPRHTKLRAGYPLKTHPDTAYQTLSIRPKR